MDSIAAIYHSTLSPTSAWSSRFHAVEKGAPVALVRIIEAATKCRPSPAPHPRAGRSLSGTIAIAWPRVDGQHVFHSGYERAVGLRRDDPVLAAMGLKSVSMIGSRVSQLRGRPNSTPWAHATGAAT
jgi:hypothetical protein